MIIVDSYKYKTSLLDPDAESFLTAAAITDPIISGAINTLVVQMKADNIWTKMKAIYPMVGGSASTHKWNLKDPRDLDAAFRLQFFGGWTHSANGALPNGSTGYANSFFNAANLSNNSGHLSYYSRTNSAVTNEIPIGVSNFSGDTQFSLVLRRPDNLTSLRATEAAAITGNVTAFSADSRGLTTGSIISSSSRKIYKNGTLLNTNSSTITWARSTFSVFIGAANIATFPPDFYTDKQCAFASIGDGLTDTEAANLYTAVQAFQTTLSRHVSVPIVSDADAQTFLNAAVIEDVTQANAVNTLVTDLKSYGIWSKMKAIYPFVGGTASTHKWNLKDPRDLDAAFRLQFFGGWTHSANGALPNGTNAYADTKLVTSTNLSVNSTHLSFYTPTQSTSGAHDIGNNLTGNFALSAYYSGIGKLFVSYSYPTESVLNTNTNSKGFIIGSRTANNSAKMYFNNSLINTLTTTRTSNLPAISLFLGATNVNSSPSFYSNKEFSFASIGDGLTDTEAANLYTAVQAFQTTLSRQV